MQVGGCLFFQFCIASNAPKETLNFLHTPYHKAWKGKKYENFDQRKKGFKPSRFINQQKQPSQAVSNPVGVTGGKPKDPQQNKGPLKCWKCEGPHLCRYCPLKNESTRPDNNI